MTYRRKRELQSSSRGSWILRTSADIITFLIFFMSVVSVLFMNGCASGAGSVDLVKPIKKDSVSTAMFTMLPDIKKQSRLNGIVVKKVKINAEKIGDSYLLSYSDLQKIHKGIKSRDAFIEMQSEYIKYYEQKLNRLKQFCFESE